MIGQVIFYFLLGIALLLFAWGFYQMRYGTTSSDAYIGLFKMIAALLLGGFLVLIFFATDVMAAERKAPVLSAEEAKYLLSMSGANPGTTKLLQGKGLVRIDAINVHTEGAWVVIRILPSLVKAQQ